MTGGPRTTLASRPREPGQAPTAEHVVLATDGREGAWAATRWLAERARSHVMDVDVVHVVPARRVHAGMELLPAGDYPTDHARSHIARVAPSVETRAQVLEGDAQAVLADLSSGVDLVVLGTRRHGGSLHLIRTFSARFAESARCPVVVVPDGWRRSSGPIVVGVVGDASDTGAIDFAAREASLLHRDLVLTHPWQLAALVWPEVDGDLGGRAEEDARAARDGIVVDRLRDRHPGLGAVRILEQDGRTRALISDGRDASLLVVGTRALRSVEQVLLHSASGASPERPACPVAVVPPLAAELSVHLAPAAQSTVSSSTRTAAA